MTRPAHTRAPAPRTRLRIAGLSICCALAAAPIAAQDATGTFRACLVPQVGALYLIALPGLPEDCLSADHEEVTWTNGGTPGDGTIDTAARETRRSRPPSSPTTR